MGKKLKLLMGVAASLFFASASLNADGTEYQNIGYNAQVVNESALPVAKEVVIDTNKLGINRISAQITASTATVSSVTFYDGKQSTMQVTVYDNTALSSAVAVGGFTVVDNTALAPAYATNLLTLTSDYLSVSSDPSNSTKWDEWRAKHFSINGTSVTENIDWTRTNYASNTLLNILAACESKSAFNKLISFKATSTIGCTQILMTAVSPGTAGNAYTLVSGTPAAITANSATFSGGTDQSRAHFAIKGTSYTEGTHWGAKSLSSETATSMAYAINRSSLTLGVKASAVGAVVFTTPIAVVRSSHGVITRTPDLWGTLPNSWGLTVSTGALLSSGTFSGGRDRATLVVGGKQIRNGLEWKSDVSAATSFSSHTVSRLATALKADTTVSSLIKISTISGEQASNSITITSMSAIVGATVTLNGVAYREGTAWNILATSMQTTVCLSTALAAGDSTIYISSAGVGGRDIITIKSKDNISAANLFSLSVSTIAMQVGSALFTGGVNPTIYSTSIRINQPYEFYTTTQGALSISSYSVFNTTYGWAYGTMQGGYESDISTLTKLISKSNSFSAGLPVLYSSNTTTGLTGLTHQTTYYVKSPTKVSFYLARTSTGAVATTTATIVDVGSYYTKFSTGGGSYTLAPWIFSGISSMTFQVSNDGVNYNMTPYSVAITSATSEDSTTFYDLGEVNYRWLKLNIAAPTITGGGVDVEAWINGKK